VQIVDYICEKGESMDEKIKKNFLLNLIFYAVIAIIIYLVLRFSVIYLFPLIIGVAVTISVQRPSGYISNRFRINKGICALIFVLLIYILLVSAMILLIYESHLYITNFTSENKNMIFTLAESIKTKIENINLFKTSGFIKSQLSNLITSFASSVAKEFANTMKKVAGATPMFLAGSLVTIIASCYIAKDYDRFKVSIKSVTNKKWSLIFLKTKALISENFIKLIIGYMKLFVITFVEIFIGLFLLQVKNAAIIAIITALLDLLPIFGTGTILIPWGIYNLFTANYPLGTGLLILYVIIIIIRNILEPKIIGKQIGLHPLIALISVFIGLKLFGVIGIFTLPLSIMLIFKMYDEGIFSLILSK
jgi:sporulation integral membrane protein YtvI